MTIAATELKHGRAWLLSLGQRQCVLVRENPELPQANKLRLLSNSPEVAGLLGSIAFKGDRYIAVEYVSRR